MKLFGSFMKAPKMWIGLFWDNDPGAFENPSFLAARLIKKLRKLCENTCDFLKFFFDVFRGQNNLKTPYSNDQCKVFDLLSYCRNSAGLNRSLISRSSIWRLIPLTNLHCLKQVVIWEQLFQASNQEKHHKNYLNQQKKPNGNHPLITGLALLGSG